MAACRLESAWIRRAAGREAAKEREKGTLESGEIVFPQVEFINEDRTRKNEYLGII